MLLILAGGYLASVVFIYQHNAPRDDKPGLSMDDLVGAYHGVERPAVLLEVVNGPHGEPYLQEGDDKQVMRKWLTSDRISEDYESLELGDFSPREVIQENCLSCHARNSSEGNGIGQTIPLEFWDDVKEVAFQKRINPTPTDILVVSTHAHAQSIPLVTLIVCGLFLLTRWPAGVRNRLFGITFFSLLLDLAGWWIARESVAFVWVVLISGGIFGAGFMLAILGCLADMWLPAPKRREP